ncbi:AAA family ATPase [Leucobacter sp. HY1910]
MLQSFTSDVAFRGLSKTPFDGTSPCKLGKRTVIYGRNGTGKTSLSEALRLAEGSGRADSATLQARIITNGSSSGIRLEPGSFPFRLFVYNRFYVQESLRLFLSGDGHASPIVQLGIDNIKAEVELESHQAYLAVLEAREASIREAMKRIELDRETLEKETKAEIISVLAPADAAYYNPTRFQVTQVRKLLDDQNATALSDEEFAAELNAATAALLGQVDLPLAPEKMAANLHLTVNDELLSASVDSVPLSRLTENADLSAWVENGLTFHSEGDLCTFCQVGIVTSDVLAAYRRHFSSALDSLRERLGKAIAYFERQRDALDSWLQSMPSESEFLPDFQGCAKNVMSDVRKDVEALQIEIGKAIAAIQRRQADPLRARPDADLLTEPFAVVDVAGFNQVLSENNAACGSQTARIKRARASVELHFGAQNGAEYRFAARRLELAQRALSTLRQRTVEVDTKRLAAQQELQDVGQMANLIDVDLREHFGHAHLRVSVTPDGTGYVVTRSGAIATHLSEGERNAIAFTYFLRSLEEEGVDPEQTIVVIDDPVTSLDKESLFATFAFARERTEQFAQAIFLTHDYEYFRLNLIDLKNRWGSSQKRIRMNDAAEKQMPEVSFLEVRAVSQAANSRHGEVRELPRSLVQHPSEYHFLFFHVAETSVGTSQEYLPLVGNAARRLLEGFLSFRAPDKINFQEKVNAVAANAFIDGALKERVVKFLHSQSHREEPRPSSALDFPSIETELAATLRFIHAADGPHFEAMCRSVDLDPVVILQNLAMQQIV